MRNQSNEMSNEMMLNAPSKDEVYMKNRKNTSMLRPGIQDDGLNLMCASNGQRILNWVLLRFLCQILTSDQSPLHVTSYSATGDEALLEAWTRQTIGLRQIVLEKFLQHISRLLVSNLQPEEALVYKDAANTLQTGIQHASKQRQQMTFNAHSISTFSIQSAISFSRV